MSRRLVWTALAIVGSIVAGLLLVVFLWLPWNPLEGRVERVVDLLPGDLDLAVRIDAEQVARSPLAKRLWEHGSLRAPRRRLGLDAAVEPLRELEARLARTLSDFGEIGDDVSVRGDLFGREVLVARRGDDLLVLTRISTRGRALEAVRDLEPAELERHGLSLDGDLVIATTPGRPPLALARHRDVLAIGTSRALVEEVLERARARGGGAPFEGAAGLAAAGRTAPDAVATFWADPAALAGDAREPRVADSAEGFWLSLLDPAGLVPLTGAVHLRGERALRVRVDGSYAREAPAALRPFGVGRGRGDPAARAGRFALPGEAIVVGGFRVPAARAVESFVDAQPPSRRDLVHELLTDAGDTPASVAARLAAHLGDGVGAVVARLPEVDELDLDTAAGGLVDPIPATVLVFVVADGASPDDVLADLRREAETLFGSPLREDPEPLDGGGRLYTLERNRFGGRMALLRPAFALLPPTVFRPGLFVFSTHDGYLRRAVADRPGETAQPSGPFAARAVVAGGPLRAFVDDQRWEHAERSSFHDWRREREQIRREMDESGVALSPEQRARLEERRILERIARRNEVEFPRAVEEYRRAWAPLGVLERARLSATLDGPTFGLLVDVDFTPR